MEGVEFVEAPFGGGVQVGLDDREVDEPLQGAPGAAAGSLSWVHVACTQYLT